MKVLNLIIFLSCFPNGILLSDYYGLLNSKHFKQFTLIPLPDDWLSPLVKICSLDPKHPLSNEEYNDLDNKICNLKFEGTSNMNILQVLYDNSKDRHNVWLSVKNETIGTTMDMLIYPNYLIREALSKFVMESDLKCRALISVIQFHQWVLTSYILLCKEKHLVSEEIYECSSLNYSAVWNKYENPDLLFQYIQESDINLNILRRKVKHFNQNFKVLVADRELLSIFGCIEHLETSEDFEADKEECLLIIEDTFIKALTVNMIVNERNECLDYINMINSQLESLSIKNPFPELKMKMNLFYCSFLFDQMIKFPLEYKRDPEKKNLEEKMNMIENQLTMMEDSEITTVFLSELNILRTEVERQGCLPHSQEKLNKTPIYLGNLNHYCNNLDDDIESQYIHDWAKATLVLLERNANIDKGEHDRKATSRKLEDIFKSEGSTKLQLLAIRALCYIYQADNSGNFEVCLKNAEEGQKTAKLYGFENLENEFRHIVITCNKRIHERYGNLFQFLISNPLKGIPPRDQLSRVNLQKDMYKATARNLSSLSSKIVYKYDVLTDELFRSLIHKNTGCKLMVLDLALTKDKCLWLEDGHFGYVKYTGKEIKELLNKENSQLNIDIIIVISDGFEEIAEYFKHPSVSFIIYFKFPKLPPNPYEYKHKYWREEFKIHFINRFISEFASKNKCAKVCIELAKLETVEKINHMVTTDTNLFQCTVNSYNKKCTQVDNEKLSISFTVDNITYMENTMNGDIYCSAQAGQPVDDSNPRWAKYIPEDLYLRRETALLDIYELLQRNQRVNLVAIEESGKTFLVKMLANELTHRDIYKDGVYYFDLKDVKNTESIRTMMSQELGDQMNDAPDTFFYKKSMLIIFDNYQKVLKKELVKPGNLLDSMEECEIHIIFVNSLCKNDEFRTVIGAVDYQLEPLSNEESLQLLLLQNAYSKWFYRFDEDSIFKLLNCKTIRGCNGLPGSLMKSAKRFYERELGSELQYRSIQNQGLRSGTIYNLEGESFLIGDSDFFGDERSNSELQSIQLDNTALKSNLSYSSGAKGSSKNNKKPSESRKDFKFGGYKAKKKKKKDMN